MTTDNDGYTIELHEHNIRVIQIPTGTRLIIPPEHKWFLMSVYLEPTPEWRPPGRGFDRDPAAFGDVQIVYNGRAYDRMSALFLMDRSMARYNLDPELATPEMIARLESAKAHARLTAPPDGWQIGGAMDDFRNKLYAAKAAALGYMEAVAPTLSFSKVAVVGDGERSLHIEHVSPEHPADRSGAPAAAARHYWAELQICTKIKVP